MKIGVLTVVYQELPVEQALERLAALGVQAVELGAGCYPGDAHCKADELLANAGAAQRHGVLANLQATLRPLNLRRREIGQIIAEIARKKIVDVVFARIYSGHELPSEWAPQFFDQAIAYELQHAQ